MEGIDIEIDKLTNSIVNRVSGDVFDTEVKEMTAKDWKTLKKKDWVFDWKKESTKFNRTVFKLVIEVSHELGFDGFVAFDAKTALVGHYQKTLGATIAGGTRMFIDEVAAQKLIN
eukprot:gene17789-24184_t